MIFSSEFFIDWNLYSSYAKLNNSGCTVEKLRFALRFNYMERKYGGDENGNIGRGREEGEEEGERREKWIFIC